MNDSKMKTCPRCSYKTKFDKKMINHLKEECEPLVEDISSDDCLNMLGLNPKSKEESKELKEEPKIDTKSSKSESSTKTSTNTQDNSNIPLIFGNIAFNLGPDHFKSIEKMMDEKYKDDPVIFLNDKIEPIFNFSNEKLVKIHKEKFQEYIDDFEEIVKQQSYELNLEKIGSLYKLPKKDIIQIIRLICDDLIRDREGQEFRVNYEENTKDMSICRVYYFITERVIKTKECDKDFGEYAGAIIYWITGYIQHCDKLLGIDKQETVDMLLKIKDKYESLSLVDFVNIGAYDRQTMNKHINDPEREELFKNEDPKCDI